MGLRETFYNWAQQYDAPEILNEEQPNIPIMQVNNQRIPPAGPGPKQTRANRSTAAYSGDDPTIPPYQQTFSVVGEIPIEWENMVGNQFGDGFFDNLPENFDWGALSPAAEFVGPAADGSWSWNVGPFSLVATPIQGINGFVGWQLSVVATS